MACACRPCTQRLHGTRVPRPARLPAGCHGVWRDRGTNLGGTHGSRRERPAVAHTLHTPAKAALPPPPYRRYALSRGYARRLPVPLPPSSHSSPHSLLGAVGSGGCRGKAVHIRSGTWRDGQRPHPHRCTKWRWPRARWAGARTPRYTHTHTRRHSSHRSLSHLTIATLDEEAGAAGLEACTRRRCTVDAAARSIRPSAARPRGH